MRTVGLSHLSFNASSIRIKKLKKIEQPTEESQDQAPMSVDADRMYPSRHQWLRTQYKQLSIKPKRRRKRSGDTRKLITTYKKRVNLNSRKIGKKRNGRSTMVFRQHSVLSFQPPLNPPLRHPKTLLLIRHIHLFRTRSQSLRHLQWRLRHSWRNTPSRYTRQRVCQEQYLW